MKKNRFTIKEMFSKLREVSSMKKHRFTILTGVILVIIVGVTLLARERVHRETLLGTQSFSVNAGDYKVMSFKIDISDKKSNIIQGRVRDRAGYGISFMVFDTKNFNAWKERNHRAFSYVKEKNSKDVSFSFFPDHSDRYFFVFDNSYSIAKNKLPEVYAIWSYKK